MEASQQDQNVIPALHAPPPAGNHPGGASPWTSTLKSKMQSSMRQVVGRNTKAASTTKSSPRFNLPFKGLLGRGKRLLTTGNMKGKGSTSLRRHRSEEESVPPSTGPPSPDIREDKAVKEEEEEEKVEQEEPAMSLMQTLEEIQRLQYFERHLVAHDLLLSLEGVLEQRGEEDQETREVRTMMASPAVKKHLDILRVKGPHCKHLVDLSYSMEGWTHASSVQDTHTYFQPAGDGRSIRVRLEGELAVSPFEQLATIREAGLFKSWIPFCRDSKLLDREGLTDMIFWMKIGVPGLFSWDMLINGYACDATREEDCLIISATSIKRSDRVSNPPEPPGGLLGRRVAIRDFSVNMKLNGPNSSKVTLVFTFDPGFIGPGVSEVINFVIKRIAGYFLHYLKEQSGKILKQWDTLPICKIIREDPFYSEFMAPRLVDLCRAKGLGYSDVIYKLCDPEAVPLSPQRPRRISRQQSTTTTTTTTTAADRAPSTVLVPSYIVPVSRTFSSSLSPSSSPSSSVAVKKEQAYFLTDGRSVAMAMAFIITWLIVLM